MSRRNHGHESSQFYGEISFAENEHRGKWMRVGRNSVPLTYKRKLQVPVQEHSGIRLVKEQLDVLA